jgi:hypothetical protein
MPDRELDTDPERGTPRPPNAAHRLRTLQLLGIAVVLGAASPATAQSPDAHRLRIGLEIGLAYPSGGLGTWLDDGLGKLRYAHDDRGFVASRWYADYSGRLGAAWTVHATVDAVEDASSGLGLTEAYVEHRPIPRSANRQRLRVGFFNAPWSLENVGPAWSTPLTLTPSAVNTWIGEELRPLGAEWSLQRRAGAAELVAHVAAFVGNDPAGSLLAWKGWSLHDRQSRYGDRLPLAALPQLSPTGMFASQAPFVQPWREIDDRVGYYAGGEWRYARRALLALEHYDNRADPTALEAGQYAWHTRFEQLAAQASLPGDVGLLAQWMTGSTVMGPVLGAAHAVDTDFAAGYVMVTRPFGAHRLTLRFDHFEVDDNDGVPNDDNSDSGHAWTFAYRYDRSQRWSLGAEWLRMESWHPAWAYFGAPPRAAETLLQARVTLRFGAAP